MDCQPRRRVPFSELTEEEAYWRDHHDWLKESGYILRPRFRPGWVASWTTDSRNQLGLCEDSWRPSHLDILDAVRESDNLSVVLKKIEKDVHPYEEALGRYLTRGSSGIFQTNFRSEWMLTCQGLQFMHHHHVAHRDCNSANIMMDGKHLYPHGFYPDIIHQDLKPNKYSDATNHTRTKLPVKYYFIDFGLSRRYEPSNVHPVEPIVLGGDNLRPFPHRHIYYLGNLIRREFLDGHERLRRAGRWGFGFMRPLVNDMVQDDPTKRPSIDQVVTRFAEIQRGLSSWKLRSRVVGKREYP
ncbi:hypothetical protein DFH06DRAFT_1005613 [Mycena polygramma]|nr:hypothetical protein DFH06DRAFT_1005613 [Mycena polygramma]